jgi:uncharacterized protein YjgD (DUF1641 family)
MSEQVQEATTLGEVERLVEAARDSMTDEMVSRLASTVSDGVELMDQVNRAKLGRAIPALAELVNNGDLDRLVQLARLYGSAQDAMTDEMVGRLAETAASGLGFIDKASRAGLERAIPALAQLVNDGDLDRLVQLARLYGSAQDAMTDEMVGRIAETMGSGLSLLDRFSRGGADRLLQMLEQLVASGTLDRIARQLPVLTQRLEMLERMLHCFEAASNAADKEPPMKGGIGPMWSLMTDPENQRSLRFLMLLGRQMHDTCVTR